MSKAWVIAPFESEYGEDYEKVWQFDKENGVISIGWHHLGDISSYSLKNLKEVAEPHEAHMLYKFYNGIKEGDTIVARYGRSTIVGVGIVKQTAYYDAEKTVDLFNQLGVDYIFPHHLDVEWDESQEEWTYERQEFGMQTLHSISFEKLKSLLDEESYYEVEDEEWEECIPSPKIDIALEKHLEDFIVSNFQQIFGSSLKIYEDSSGVPIGQQYNTGEVGVIDILSMDTGSNEFVVIELKKGRPSDKVVGQLTRYMGWVSQNLCKKGQSVRGLIICKDSDIRLQCSVEALPNVQLKYY